MSSQTNENDVELIDVLYNGCYGGFSLSQKAADLYNERMITMNKINGKTDYKKIGKYDFYSYKRHDPLLVQIYNELGNEFNTSYSKVKIITIPNKYQNHYTITEYDGLEDVEIDFHKYKVDIISEILNSSDIDNDEKINKIQYVINEPDCDY
jgi:hypothetical protein